MPHSLSLVARVRRALFHEAGLRPRDGILLAVSGGPDSCALAHVTAEVCRKLALRVMVAHVDHGLRPRAAKRDARFVEAIAEKYGFLFRCECVDVRSLARLEKRSLEDAARRARLAFFDRLAREFGAKAVLLAHTADDQIETFFLGLFRGSGSRGLRAMEEDREVHGVRILRPFLTSSRREILAYVRARHLLFRRDSSNRLLVFARNRIRHRILPFLEKNFSPGVRRAVRSAQENLVRDDRALEAATKAIFPRILLQKSAKNLILDRARLAALPGSICFRVLEKALALFGQRGMLTRAAGLRVEAALAKRHPAWCPVAGSLGFWVRKNGVFLGHLEALCPRHTLSKGLARKTLRRPPHVASRASCAASDELAILSLL